MAEVALALVHRKGFFFPKKISFVNKLFFLERGLTLYCSASDLVHQFESFYLF